MALLLLHLTPNTLIPNSRHCPPNTALRWRILYYLISRCHSYITLPIIPTNVWIFVNLTSLSSYYLETKSFALNNTTQHNIQNLTYNPSSNVAGPEKISHHLDSTTKGPSFISSSISIAHSSAANQENPKRQQILRCKNGDVIEDCPSIGASEDGNWGTSEHR